ncbi:F-box/kelch-repeat protein At3g06240-like [Papaver somniferum]|uniref:F-box/kelch-repeat protein At3g06240-like n=1 Tax=Papaver somniferum TaxID=3469 RepID=UPI000E704D63|nr:F-box/kelch-repeat protein At3g06240-like [Papaver somniferum]
MDKSSLYHVEYDFEKNDEQVFQKPKDELFDLGSLGYFDKENIIIVGSCNDLVCLTTKNDNYLCGHVYVCNPITQECTQLPGLVPNNKDYKDAGYGSNLYGFGYLHSSDEYKVVRISYKVDPNIGAIFQGEIHVNTLGDGRGWRYREEIITNQLHCSEQQGIFVDGALYWKSSTGLDIGVFDLTDEKLYMLHPPPRARSEWGHFKMVALGGQLCFFQATTYHSSNIWLLEKRKGTYGNCSSPIWIEGASHYKKEGF